MAEQFAVGDVVVLKSGGPTMTVERVGTSQLHSEQRVFCTWCDDKNVEKHGDYAPGMLQKAE